MKKYLSLAFAVCGITLFLAMPGVSNATSLTPGSTITPGPGTNFPAADFGASILADTGTVTVVGSGAQPFTASVREIVVRDTVTGNIDFLYQFVNVGPNPSTYINAMSVDSYGTFTTDVGESTGYANLVSGSFTPLPVDGSINRGPTGQVITFNWASQINPAISPNLADGTEVIVVRTNAPTWQSGTMNFIDGSIGSTPGFAPAVPEPATLLLLGFGLVGLVGAGRKFKK
ncbi:MAG TPA: PEP-CTERM sorting domain-containing protein [Syntrophorhabdales bacterium]|nr:PEP-CTERM sorting domain-containing protein [Syntrophorhabdales bacterium]